ncbi:MAG: dephospho-CoA kinase [Deltaproteobacteria bacterium]|jgi:dephospho-CoA kinase|nr:dephospho-CoA kinase [Deltaproteobacteria bacterium]
MPESPPELTRRPEEPPPPSWALDVADALKSQPGRVRAALTGGVASGKSTVASLLVALGADLIDFDVLAREVLAPFTPGWTEALKLFGPKFQKPDQSLDRPKIAALVFKKPLIRRALENIVHPLTWELTLQKLDELKDSPLVIIDVPLLFEANLNSLFKPVVVCFADPETQYLRLRARDPKKSRFLVKRMIKSQKPYADKIRLADAIIDNRGSLSRLIQQTKDLWLRLKAWPNGA